MIDHLVRLQCCLSFNETNYRSMCIRVAYCMLVFASVVDALHFGLIDCMNQKTQIVIHFVSFQYLPAISLSVHETVVGALGEDFRVKYQRFDWVRAHIR